MAHTIEYGGDLPEALTLVTSGLLHGYPAGRWFVEIIQYPNDTPTVRGHLMSTRTRNGGIDVLIAITDEDGLERTGKERWIPADSISKLIIP